MIINIDLREILLFFSTLQEMTKSALSVINTESKQEQSPRNYEQLFRLAHDYFATNNKEREFLMTMIKKAGRRTSPNGKI